MGRALVDKGSWPRVTRRRWEDRGRRRRVPTRFTTWTLSPAISVNAFFFLLYRSNVLVDFVAFVLGVLICSGVMARFGWVLDLSDT